MNQLNPYISPTTDTPTSRPSPKSIFRGSIFLTLLGFGGMAIGRVEIFPTLFGWSSTLTSLFDIAMIYLSFVVLLLPGLILCVLELRQKFSVAKLVLVIIGLLSSAWWLLFMISFLYGFTLGFTMGLTRAGIPRM